MNSSSVVVGLKVTIRAAGAISTLSPKSSTIRLVEAWLTAVRSPVHARSVKDEATKTVSAKRETNMGTRTMRKGARNDARRRDQVAHVRVATGPPPRISRGADESRLLAPGRDAHLPDRGTMVSGEPSARLCPLQWRGRTGITPVSVAPVRDRIVPRI